MAMNNKQPFLLLRGLAREQRHWGDFVPLMQTTFPDNTILTMDIPGNGSLYQRKSPITIAGMTEALRQQLSLLSHRQPINLIALSMGGMMAIDWMTRYPDEIASAVLINSSVRGFAPFYQRLCWQNYAKFFKLCWQTPAAREKLILALTANHHGHNHDLLSHWQAWQQQCPLSWQNAVRQIFAAAQFKAIQKPLPPILIITSVADRLVDYRCSVSLHKAWATAYAQHPSAGHDIPLDDPQWVVNAVKNWLERFD